MPIDTKHPQYLSASRTWETIENVTRGKSLHQYLRYLNPQDKTEANAERNRAYRRYAVFYALAQQTASGMVGTVFRKWPEFTVPTELEYLTENADGAGVSIYQQSQAITDEVVRKGRAALVVSFPQTTGQVSRADLIEGRVVATISRLEPEQVINWRTETIRSHTRLALVVISEITERIVDDPYRHEQVEVIREMFLDEGIYREREWQMISGEWQLSAEYTPTDASGQTWDELPFIFVGSENNDPSIDPAPLAGIVELNIAHYRNSADFEDSVFYCGQAQPWASGLTPAHVEEMQKHSMYVGSRVLLPIPEGGSFGFANADPNPIVRQAMLDKVDMMVGLGARMIQPGSAAKTATQARGDLEVQHSVLSLIASNVSEAYTRALSWVARYMGAADNDLAYTLSQDFVAPDATAQDIQALVAGYIQGAIPMADYVARMKKVGVFIDDKTIEEYADELTTPGVARFD